MGLKMHESLKHILQSFIERSSSSLAMLEHGWSLLLRPPLYAIWNAHWSLLATQT